ncbi:MAG: class I SAM-dependent methyltransferase [Chloroflexi bacterium]|nr:class I SAM-dependent methyltransferase [Chloroflexota bacterium]
MATRAEIERHYDTMGVLHVLAMKDVQGDYPDYSCAFFDGDFNKSYVQAQADKHAWIFDGLDLGQDLQGKRVLDIGCGWGPMLNATRKRGGHGVGLTLSSGQAEYCQKRGLDVRLRDYKTLSAGELGIFDGIVSLGAFEHFCSVEDLLASKQGEVYRNFFRICAEHLPPDGRLYLQTMTWGKQVPDYRTLSLDAPPDSMEAILARILYLFPGSWLPNGLTQLIECASEHFDFISSNNGRLDYLQTITLWGQATPNLWKLNALPRTLRHAIPWLLKVLTDHDASVQFQSRRRRDMNACFAREIMSHERIFFVKKSRQ